MWNWDWQDAPDYGRKYDWGFYEIHPTEMARFYKHNKASPRCGWIGSKLTPPVKPYDGPLPSPSEVLDPAQLEAQGRLLGGAGTKGRLRLTRGARAVAWGVKRLSSGGQLLLVGFDGLRAGLALPSRVAFPDNYLESPAIFPLRDYDAKCGGTKYSNHDYAVEYPLLKSIASNRGVTLRFAQDVWT